MTSGPQFVKGRRTKSQRERMKMRRPHAQLVWVAIVVMLAGIVGIASAEESSILQEATMSGNEVDTPSHFPAIDNSLIAGNYKVLTRTDSTDPKVDGTKEFVINWPSAYKFVSCFIANYVYNS